jgi:hypothetical protein
MGIGHHRIGHWAKSCESFLCAMRHAPCAMRHTINVLSNMTAAI